MSGLSRLSRAISFLRFQPTRLALREYGHDLRPVLAVLVSSDVYTLASAIATCAILSFPPFTVLLSGVLRKFPYSSSAVDVIKSLLVEYIPSGGDAVASIVKTVTATSGSVQFVSALILILSATGVFIPIEVALNRTWNAAGNMSFIKNQIVSIGVMLACGFLALLSFLIGGLSVSLVQFVFGLLPFPTFAVWAGGAFSYFILKLLGFVLSVAVFFIIFYYLPNTRLSLDKTVRVAVFTGVVWELGRHVFIHIVPLLDLKAIYGWYFEGAVILVLWSYVSAMIMIVGAELGYRELLSLERFRSVYAQWVQTAQSGVMRTDS
jgi:membrane protein